MPDIDLEANLAKATEAPAIPVTVGKKPKPTDATKAPAKSKPAIKPPPEGLASPLEKPGPQPGSPCEVKGCIGRYSVLQTTKNEENRLRSRDLICRTCMHRPDKPHISRL